MVRQVLSKALTEKIPVEIIYVDAAGKWSKRRIRIRALTECQVLAYCYERRAVRAFHMDRIYAVQKLFGTAGLLAELGVSEGNRTH